jgi:energy-coupling factor transport system ATP-binding protein
MIELKRITVELPPERPEAVAVLRDIDLSMGEGDWVALVGPNGSGKTTLLKTLAGLLPAASGSMRIGGVAASGASRDTPPRISLLLQEPDNQFVASSVENELLLSVPPSVNGEPGARAQAAVERFDLARFIGRNPHRLSGGEKQRLALATVWLSEPRVLLLDEPASYLDAEERLRCVEFVRELNRDGVIVVWATPGGRDVHESKRVVYIDGGEIRFDGTPDRFFEAAVERNLEWLQADGASNVEGGQPTAHDKRQTPDEGKEGAAVGARPRETGGGPVAALQNVSFHYDGQEVLSGVDFKVSGGEYVGVSGRNGSGKSTLLSLLSGILEPTGGTMFRKYAQAVGAGTQNVFHLFQSPERLFFAETVLEEIAFGLRSLGTPKEEIPRRAAEALSDVGLAPEKFLTRSPFSLSFGEMRRVAFAMVLSLRPKFVLLDEPASCLDAPGRIVLDTMIGRLRQEGAAIVAASHDLSLFEVTAGRIYELPATGRQT